MKLQTAFQAEQEQRRLAEDQAEIARIAAASEEEQRKKAEAAQATAEKAKQDETQAREHLDRLLYNRRVSLAHSMWHENEVGRARELLSECKAEQRGWEWHYVNRL